MFKIKQLILFVCLATLSVAFVGCDDDLFGEGWRSVTSATIISGNRVSGGVYNGNMEIVSTVDDREAAGWSIEIPNFNAPNNYTYERTTDESSSDSTSLMVSATTIDAPNEFAVFRQTIENPGILPGALIRFKVRVKTENARGNGFYAVVNGDDGQFIFLTTDGF